MLLMKAFTPLTPASGAMSVWWSDGTIMDRRRGTTERAPDANCSADMVCGEREC
jgi:hypothetical protein